MKKIIIFVVLLFLSIVILVVSSTGILHFSCVSIEDVESSRTKNNDLITSLRINDLFIPYYKESNTYYYYYSESNKSRIISLNFNLENGYSYSIEDSTLNYVAVDYNKEYKFVIYNKDEYYESKIVFTNLPTMQITDNDEINGDDTEATYYLTSNTFTNDFYSGYLKIHTRGGTTYNDIHSSYRINLYKNNKYKKQLNASLLGIYNGDSYILDAMYYDTSKIRNQISSQIWNDINPSVKENGEYVELFINNEYKGLYVLKEPINKTKLDLMGTNSKDNSVIIKTITYGVDLSDKSFDNINSYSYNVFEMKYPNDEQYYNRSWKNILTKIQPYFDDDEKSFDLINNIFDIDNYINYSILGVITSNYDGKFEKNAYYYMNSLEDDKVKIMPWDFDLTFGEYWSEETIFAATNYKDFKSDLSWSLTEEPDKKVRDLIVNRYKEVRKTIFTDEYIDSMIDTYYNQINKGSIDREQKKWNYNYDINEEIENVRTWLHNRLNYLDGVVGDYDE